MTINVGRADVKLGEKICKSEYKTVDIGKKTYKFVVLQLL